MTVSDGTIEAYQARVDSWLSPLGWQRELPRLKPSAKVVEGMPVSFPGVSLFAASDSVEWLNFARLRDYVLSRLTGQHYPVADHSLHLTMADLIAGDGYRLAHNKHRDLDARIAERVASVLRALGPLSKPLEWRVAGITFLRHAVACLVEPCSIWDYEPICRIRDLIYEDRLLSELGVVRPRPLLAHVTLAYFGVLPNVEERSAWLKPFDEFQKAGHSFCSNLEITGATLCKFESMAAFEQVSRPLSFSSREA